MILAAESLTGFDAGEEELAAARKKGVEEGAGKGWLGLCRFCVYHGLGSSGKILCHMSVQTYGLGSECVNDTSLVRSSLSAGLARRQEYRSPGWAASNST